MSAAAYTEEGHARGMHQVAVDLDLQKAFDHIPRAVVWALASQVRMPPGIVLAWPSWYSQDQARYYRHCGGLGQPWQARSGFVQGCALSCIAQNLLMSTLLRALDKETTKFPTVDFKETAYAHDTKWQFRCPAGEERAMVACVQGCLRIATTWANEAKQLFNAAKSAVWTSHAELTAENCHLQGANIPFCGAYVFPGGQASQPAKS